MRRHTVTVARVGRIDASTAAASTAPRHARPPGGRGAGCCWRSASPRGWRGPTWCPTAPTSSTFTCTSAAQAALDHRGTLYDYVYADQTPDFPLPFTYPPFAAVVFYPLHLLPFGILAFAWQLGIIAALYGVVRISQRLLPDPAASRRVAMLWTAVGIWIEPLRSTFDYGQINVLLVLAVLYAVYSTRWWLSGLLVGLAAGVKLTPAVVGPVLRRRAAMGDRGVLGGGVLRHGRGLGVGRRRPNPLLLHRTARRRLPGGPDRNVVQPVLARRDLADSRARRGLRAAGAGRRSRSPRCWPCWPGAPSAAHPTGSARSSSCSCSGCCCRRSRGRITGCG